MTGKFSAALLFASEARGLVLVGPLSAGVPPGGRRLVAGLLGGWE